MPYLNCPDCYYRVRSEVARSLDGEASCPRCARIGRLVAMYSTEISLRATAEAGRRAIVPGAAAAGGVPDPQAPEAI